MNHVKGGHKNSVAEYREKRHSTKKLNQIESKIFSIHSKCILIVEQ